jgi:uncharacterized Zn finger protein
MIKEKVTKLKIHQKDVQNWVDTRSYERGFRYFKKGVIQDVKLQGMTLKAYCQGSKLQPYRVSASFDQEGIIEASCSCPIGKGGHCKHVAALLLKYIHHPKEFREVEEIDSILEKRTREDLILLIKQMVTRRPELEGLIEIALPKELKKHASIDPESYRRQAASAFVRSHSEWYDERVIADELNSIIKLGKDFANRNDYANAAVVYREVSREVLSNYEMFSDEEGELGIVVNNCVEGLGQCLSKVKNDTLVRGGILHALFEIYHFDVDFGGVGLADNVPDIILEHATFEERKTIADLIRNAMPSGKEDDWSDNWQRQEYGGFLLDLEKEILDDERYLKICRETGRIEDLVSKLLTMKQAKEAIAEVEKASDYEIVSLADIFVAYGKGTKAEQLLINRSKHSNDSRIPEWLKNRYKKQGDMSAALSFSLRCFQLQKNLSGYQEIRDLAQKVERWPDLKKKLLIELSKQKNYNLLTEIHLDENEIDQALETQRFIQDYIWNSSLKVKVAQAAEKTRPHAAINIYHQLVEALIRARSRNNYRQACVYLSRARKIYKGIDQDEKWTHYIEALRKQNCNLPALIDELSKANI